MNWPNKNISPFDLAHQGFYFTGEGDNCICYFCNLKVNFWEVGDEARSEHFRWNPHCPFLRNLARNIDIGKEFAGPIRNSNQVTDGMQLERLKKSAYFKSNNFTFLLWWVVHQTILWMYPDVSMLFSTKQN